MTDSKKKRMSMLDSLAAVAPPAPAATTAMMANNRALRSARDAVDAHQVWDLDPAAIIDDRVKDRLDPDDVVDLRDAIEANGQTVPILVRRHPSEPDKYLLVYGRRRLEAIKSSAKVAKVRALVANLDDTSAVQAQISENMARRDLSYIEKALFAKELIENGFGNQSQVAEVLTVTKSSISMAIAIVDMVGADLIRMIGAAHGIGRPRWENLGKLIEAEGLDRSTLERVAEDIHVGASVTEVTGGVTPDPGDISVAAFEAVERAATKAVPEVAAPPAPQKSRALKVGGKRGGSIKRTGKGIAITLTDSAFTDWVEAQAQDLITELHQRWQQRIED